MLFTTALLMNKDSSRNISALTQDGELVNVGLCDIHHKFVYVFLLIDEFLKSIMSPETFIDSCTPYRMHRQGDQGTNSGFKSWLWMSWFYHAVVFLFTSGNVPYLGECSGFSRGMKIVPVCIWYIKVI